MQPRMANNLDVNYLSRLITMMKNLFHSMNIENRESWQQCEWKMSKHFDYLMNGITLPLPMKESFIGEPVEKKRREKDYYLKTEGYIVNYASAIASASKYLLEKNESHLRTHSSIIKLIIIHINHLKD